MYLDEWLARINANEKLPAGTKIEYWGENVKPEDISKLAIALQSDCCSEGLHIDFPMCDIDDAGICEIADALQSGNCPVGIHINLHSNRIGFHGACAIAHALCSGRCPPGLYLDISMNNIGEEGIQEIIGALKSGNCPFGVRIELAFRFMLKHNFRDLFRENDERCLKTAAETFSLFSNIFSNTFYGGVKGTRGSDQGKSHQNFSELIQHSLLPFIYGFPLTIEEGSKILYDTPKLEVEYISDLFCTGVTAMLAGNWDTVRSTTVLATPGFSPWNEYKTPACRYVEGIALKTQTFGLTDHGYNRSFGFSRRHSREDQHELVRLKKIALANYRKHRENGENVDNPSWEFPADGKYGWRNLADSSYVTDDEWRAGKVQYVIYTAGSNDKRWMQEKDQNYLARLGVIKATEEKKLEKQPSPT